MDETLPLDADARNVKMSAAIDEWISEAKELHAEMRLQDVAIEDTRRETQAVLDEIATVLADLKAA